MSFDWVHWVWSPDWGLDGSEWPHNRPVFSSPLGSFPLRHSSQRQASRPLGVQKLLDRERRGEKIISLLCSLQKGLRGGGETFVVFVVLGELGSLPLNIPCVKAIAPFKCRRGGLSFQSCLQNGLIHLGPRRSRRRRNRRNIRQRRRKRSWEPAGNWRISPGYRQGRYWLKGGESCEGGWSISEEEESSTRVKLPWGHGFFVFARRNNFYNFFLVFVFAVSFGASSAVAFGESFEKE